MYMSSISYLRSVVLVSPGGHCRRSRCDAPLPLSGLVGRYGICSCMMCFHGGRAGFDICCSRRFVIWYSGFRRLGYGGAYVLFVSLILCVAMLVC